MSSAGFTGAIVLLKANIHCLLSANSKAVSLEFENNINHRHLKTFKNKRVLYFIVLHLDDISGTTCLQI